MLNKKNIFLLVVIAWISVAMPQCSVFAGDAGTSANCDQNLYKAPADEKNNLILGVCLLSLLFLGNYHAQSDSMPEELKSQFLPKNIVANFALNYFTYFACNFFHELGHGLAKKMLTGSDFKIHLGKNSGGNSNVLFDTKYFSIDGIDPILGHNTSEIKKYTSRQKILINLAGGVSGILGYYFMRTAMFFVYNLFEQGDKSVFSNFKNASSNAITIDQIVVGQLLNMLIPMQFGSKLGGDAVNIWQALGFKNDTIKSVAGIQPCLAMLAFIAIVFKQANSNASDERYLADKILIGLSNYFLQGFLRFKSA